MAKSSDLTIAILREIRDEIVTTRTELSARIDETRTELSARIDETNSRVAAVEGTLLELAEQQRFVVRHLQVLTDRDRRLEVDVDALRTRVDAIERRLPPPRRRSRS